MVGRLGYCSEALIFFIVALVVNFCLYFAMSLFLYVTVFILILLKMKKFLSHCTHCQRLFDGGGAERAIG